MPPNTAPGEPSCADRSELPVPCPSSRASPSGSRSPRPLPPSTSTKPRPSTSRPIPATPTPLAFDFGSNTVTGTVAAGAGDTRDFFTFELAAGQLLTGIFLLDYTDVASGTPGNRGFHAINSGATSFIPSGATAASFLAGDHLDPVAPTLNLLDGFATSPLTGSGLTSPLGAGVYSYVVQQTGPPLTAYSLEFVVVPEPSTALLLMLGLVGLGGARGSRTRA